MSALRIVSRLQDLNSYNLPGRWVDVKSYGAKGDGAADDRAAIQAAIDALSAQGGGILLLPVGRYRLSKYLLLQNRNDITVLGVGGATLVYPSDSASVTADGIAILDMYARSAFFLSGCSGITFQRVGFEGGQSADLTLNQGAGVCATNSTDVHLFDCRQKYGSSLFRQDSFANDVGARIHGCSSFATRGNLTIGNDGVISGNRFELPTTTDFDRLSSSVGSSHAIYIFAGRSNVVIEGNTFKNIRTTGVKVSGSSLPIRNISILSNLFYDCGSGVVAGADDVQEHSGILISWNQFVNCGTNRSGWSDQAAIWILGVVSAQIANNNFFYNRDCIAAVAGVRGIFVSRYTTASSPIESLGITNNQFQARLGTGFASSPAAITTFAIDVQHVGQGAVSPGACLISGNEVHQSAAIGLNTVENVGLVVTDNVFANVVTAIQSNGNRIPVYQNNTLIVGAFTSGNAQLKLTNDCFPIVTGNRASSRLAAAGAQSFSVSAGGSAAEDYPLLGSRGRVLPTGGRPEVLLAYGAGWTNGDTVNVNGTMFTYQSTIANGAIQFNSPTTLVALIDGMANIGCADYGNPWAVSTGHLRIRWDVANATANFFFVGTTTANPTAGVLLKNGTGANLGFCFSRGEGAVAGTRTVIWSPLAALTGIPVLLADNVAAQNALLLPPIVTSRPPESAGCCLVIDHAPTVGSEQFRFLVEG